MTKGILGRKVGMTQIYDESGKVIPVTVIQAGPCQVLQVRTVDRDGYEAIQLGYGDKPRRLARRSERGHVAKLASKRSRVRAAAGVQLPAKADCEPKRFIRELRGPVEGFQVGQVLSVDMFSPVLDQLPAMLRELAEKFKVDVAKSNWQDTLHTKRPDEYRQVLASIAVVDVTGTSKGRGFAGVIKRHHFSGQRATHGVKKVHRHGGSVGASADPHHVFKGKRMPGHLGASRVTIRNMPVVRVDLENNLMLVRGAVPGPNGGFVVVRATNKVR
jgi:large subunit ribosomal protein L3